MCRPVRFINNIYPWRRSLGASLFKNRSGVEDVLEQELSWIDMELEEEQEQHWKQRHAKTWFTVGSSLSSVLGLNQQKSEESDP